MKRTRVLTAVAFLALAACDSAGSTGPSAEATQPGLITFCSSSGDCGPEPREIPDDTTEWNGTPLGYGQPYSGHTIWNSAGRRDVRLWAGNKNYQNVAYSTVSATFRMWKYGCDKPNPTEVHRQATITGAYTEGFVDAWIYFDPQFYYNYKIGVEANHHFVSVPGIAMYVSDYYTNWRKCISEP